MNKGFIYAKETTLATAIKRQLIRKLLPYHSVHGNTSLTHMQCLLFSFVRKMVSHESLSLQKVSTVLYRILFNYPINSRFQIIVEHLILVDIFHMCLNPKTKNFSKLFWFVYLNR